MLRPRPLLLLTLLLIPALAHADEPDEGRSRQAEALFERGRDLLAAGNVKEACPLLAESQRLDPGGGTLLNLAICHDRSGALATAWLEYHDALGIAHRDGRVDRERLATAQLQAIEPRLPYLLVTLPSDAPRAIEVRLDGATLSPLALGAPLPVDPGPHEITATAAGYAAWSTHVPDVAEGEHVGITIPSLVAIAQGPSPASWHTPVALTAGVLGVVGLAVGAGLGAKALSDWSNAKGGCQGGTCTPTAYPSYTAAHGAGIGSTAGFVAGGALLAGGAAVWLTRPKNGPSVGLRPDGVLMVAGVFR